VGALGGGERAGGQHEDVVVAGLRQAHRFAGGDVGIGGEIDEDVGLVAALGAEAAFEGFAAHLDPAKAVVAGALGVVARQLELGAPVGPLGAHGGRVGL